MNTNNIIIIHNRIIDNVTIAVHHLFLFSLLIDYTSSYHILTAEAIR